MQQAAQQCLVTNEHKLQSAVPIDEDGKLRLVATARGRSLLDIFVVEPEWCVQAPA